MLKTIIHILHTINSIILKYFNNIINIIATN
jgi:hypothetical protein